jgi:hypothetical protein
MGWKTGILDCVDRHPGPEPVNEDAILRAAFQIGQPTSFKLLAHMAP